MKRLSYSCSFFQSIESELGQLLNALLVFRSIQVKSNLWLHAYHSYLKLGKTPFPCPLLTGEITRSPYSSFMVQARQSHLLSQAHHSKSKMSPSIGFPSTPFKLGQSLVF